MGTLFRPMIVIMIPPRIIIALILMEPGGTSAVRMYVWTKTISNSWVGILTILSNQKWWYKGPHESLWFNTNTWLDSSLCMVLAMYMPTLFYRCKTLRGYSTNSVYDVLCDEILFERCYQFGRWNFSNIYMLHYKLRTRNVSERTKED